jgi:hypothetical protein
MDKKTKNLFWLLFLASIVTAVLVYLYVPALTSLMAIPLVTTLVKALDII